MFIAKAKELCPQLIVVPYEFDKYEEASEQVGILQLCAGRCNVIGRVCSLRALCCRPGIDRHEVAANYACRWLALGWQGDASGLCNPALKRGRQSG